MEDQRLKELRFKAAALKRLIKEKACYIKEVSQEKLRLQKMIDDGKDIYEINKQKEILCESETMVPNTEDRLKKLYTELKNMLQECENDLYESEEIKMALEALREAAQ